jgi:microcystin-dependent protein
MSLSPINITWSVGTLPGGSTYSPQDFLNALPTYLSGSIDASAFLPGGASTTMPGSDAGLYMDYSNTPPTLKVWNSTLGRYTGDQTEFPIGGITAYAGATIPSNYLECIGQTVAVASYPDLYAALGGLGSPFTPVDASNFTLPDLRSRTIVGAGTGTGLTTRSFASDFGTEDLPSLTNATGTVQSGTGATVVTGVSYSGGRTDANTQPSMALKWIIRAK